MLRALRIAALVMPVALLTIGVPGRALAKEATKGSGWGFKMWAATTYVAPLSESQLNVGGVTAAVKASTGMGYEFGAEFRTGLLGFALDYQHARQDLEHDAAGLLGTAEFNPISATLVLHLPTPVLELSAGGTVSYVNWGELDLRNGTTQPLGAKLGYGLSFGADFPLGKALAVSGGMRWLTLQAEPKSVGAIDVNPFITHVGLALRF